jgi:hypothetical protein
MQGKPSRIEEKPMEDIIKAKIKALGLKAICIKNDEDGEKMIIFENGEMFASTRWDMVKWFIDAYAQYQEYWIRHNRITPYANKKEGR